MEDGLGVLTVQDGGLAGFATPVVTKNVLTQVGEGIVATLAFVLGLTWQNDLSRNQSYVVTVVIIIVMTLLLYTVLGFLRETLQARADAFVKAPRIAGFLIKIVYMTVAFLVGVLSRIVSDLVTAAPRVGYFGLVTLVKPFVIIVLITMAMYQMELLHSPRKEINDRLDAAIRRESAQKTQAPAA